MRLARWCCTASYHTALLVGLLGLPVACHSDEDTRQAAAASASAAPAAPSASAPSRSEPGRGSQAGAPRETDDITVPPGDVDVHVINGRNIISARLDSQAVGDRKSASGAEVRVTFWTTPDGHKLPAPRQFEGNLAELELGAGDLPMLKLGEKRRLWIPGPNGMATLDVELLRAPGEGHATGPP